MTRVAFLFPGQGSQKVGMGRDFYDTFDEVKTIFDMADAVAGAPIRRLCFDGPMADLTETISLQPAMTAMNLACLTGLVKAGIRPAVSAGHSLGEFAALHEAGVFDREALFRLVVNRGRLMNREAERRKGGMAAVIGLDIDTVADITRRASAAGCVSVANHNSREQIIVTGEVDAVSAAGQAAREQGARVIPLKVSGAWHSELMTAAQEDFADILTNTRFVDARHPVALNVTADYADSAEQIKSIMSRQLCSPVRWFDIMTRLLDDGIDTFVEVGPGNVLSGLLKKSLPAPAPDIRIHTVNSMEQLERTVAAIG